MLSQSDRPCWSVWQSLSVSINLLGMPPMFVSLPLQTIRYKSDRPCRSVGQSLSVNTKPSCHSVYVWQSLSACRSDPVCRTAPACSSISACLPTPAGHYRLWRLAYCTVALNIFFFFLKKETDWRKGLGFDMRKLIKTELSPGQGRETQNGKTIENKYKKITTVLG